MTQMSLFTAVNVIDFHSLKDMTFQDWKTIGNSLNDENLQIIESYYNIEYSQNIPPYYHCLPLFNTITNDNSYKFVIINKDNDELFVAYKVIQIITTKLIKIFDKPISKNKNHQNEIDVIRELEKLDYFKFCYKKNYESLYTKLGVVDEQDCDYFYNYNIQKERYTNKYLSKNKFNRYENGDFEIKFTNQIDVCELHNLRIAWEKTKAEQGIEITTSIKKFDKAMENLNGYPNCLFLNIYYKGELVLNYCFLIYKRYCINLYRTTLSRSMNVVSDDSWVKGTFQRLDKYAVYQTLKYLKEKLNIDYVYYGGAHPSNKTLLKHKKMHSSGCLTYLEHNSK